MALFGTSRVLKKMSETVNVTQSESNFMTSLHDG